MLLQRLRSAEPTVEAAIAYNLVDLALEAPESSFADIIKAFSIINRSANTDDPRFSNNMVSRVDRRQMRDTECLLGPCCADSFGKRTETKAGLV